IRSREGWARKDPRTVLDGSKVVDRSGATRAAELGRAPSGGSEVALPFMAGALSILGRCTCEHHQAPPRRIPGPVAIDRKAGCAGWEGRARCSQVRDSSDGRSGYKRWEVHLRSFEGAGAPETNPGTEGSQPEDGSFAARPGSAGQSRLGQGGARRA